MSHRSQLLRRLLLAMGLGALPVGVLSSCVTERPSDPGSSDDDDGAPPGPLDVDNDGDGHTENEGDCDDGNAQIHPEAEELCDDVDNNCDGVIDEGVDEDGDTYRNCDIPDLIDCDDDNAAIHPGAIELCDGLDNDCDGLTDEDASDASTWYADSDSDGYGDANDSQQACDPPPGYVADNSDCDDADADTSPGDPEVPGDQQDNNCSGFIDEVDCPDAVVPTSEADILHGPNTFHMFCDGLPASGICPTPDFNVTSSLIIATVGAPSEPFCDWFTISTCGPDDTEATQCCYVLSLEQQCVTVGRPLLVEGQARVAPVVAEDTWPEAMGADFSELSSARREALLAAWSNAAQTEHASIASFARFTMQLLAHGAPPDLVAGATRAQGDELAHARACFGIASAIAGEKLGPGQLDIEGVWEMGSDARDLLVSTIVEGCINETLAASEAAWLSESCRVASVSEALAQIAEDEGRHAALAWRTIRWILSEHPELAQVAASTFATGLPTEGPEPVGPRDDVWLAGYGCMPAHESRRLARDVWREVITPCATALLRAEACGDVAIQP